MTTKIDPSADVDKRAVIGEGSVIWNLVQVRERAKLGANCVVGRGAYIGAGVSVGQNCKIQNAAIIYEPAVLGTGVFVGPAAVLTNDLYPRAVNPDLTLKSIQDWEAAGVTVGDGASIGARAVCVAPLKVGRWAMVAAGAVVIDDVPNFALVAGVPAKRIRWVGHAGFPLTEGADGNWVCPRTGRLYQQTGPDRLVPADDDDDLTGDAALDDTFDDAAARAMEAT